MKVSRKFLEERLKKVRNFNEFEELGFASQAKSLQEYTSNHDFFERLWVMINNEGIGIVIVDEGNSWCKVIAFLDEFLNEQKVFNQGEGYFDHFVTMNNQEYHEEMERTIKKFGIFT